MKWLFRIENLLLFIPLIPVFFYTWTLWSAWYGQNKYELYAIGPEVSPGFEIFLLLQAIIHVLALVLPLYLMHYFLRIINRRNQTVCYIHVITTLIYALYTQGGQVATSVVPGWHTTIYPPVYIWTTLLFFLLQAAFIIYGFITIQNWRKARA